MRDERSGYSTQVMKLKGIVLGRGLKFCLKVPQIGGLGGRSTKQRSEKTSSIVPLHLT
ncbi:hypothetical protein ACKFKH_12270 [Phormidesmis sp. 146-20]